MLKVYNTLSRQKEIFEPIEAGKIRMYVCGPTVYNYIHIGNARSVVAFDTIRRYLEFSGYDVHYVSNFTDVDDKIIKRAQEEGLTAEAVALKYIAAFYADTDALNVKRANLNPRVMETMPEIIAFIEALIDKGFAYESAGDVYFRARHFDNYGKLSDQSLNDLQIGASERINSSQQALKEDALDFALWKASKPGEPNWSSPWGPGRPGWHIECSVMATTYLGNTIDIHAGGHDLIFPHHENEIAQSEAKTGEPFARYWLHNGFVTIGEEGEKMSKSLGNFVLAHELLKQVDPQIVRLFLASSHYRHPIKFSQANLEEAKRQLQRFRVAFDNLTHRQSQATPRLDSDADWFAKIEAATQAFKVAMDDDFNTPNGLTVIEDLIKKANYYLEGADASQAVLGQFKATLRELLGIYGVELTEAVFLDEDVQALITKRDAARKAKDYATSDAIRDQLKEAGIILDDTPQGTRWRRA